MSRLLLVEDSQVQAVVTRIALEDAGHRVQHVRNVEEALKACYEDAPSLVISDQHLGEVSGLELCRRIKSDVVLSVIPVLMLTGSQARKHHVAALDSGADGFLSKDRSSAFTRRARQWAIRHNQQLGVLVLTGAERKDVLLKSLEAGADDYVDKSQDMDVIVAHTTALARRIARTRQIESMNRKVVRQDVELREAELQRIQAGERARLADELERVHTALAESNEQLKLFASVASHDLQVPLRRVISLCELLQSKEQDKLDAESAEYLQSMVESAQGMQRLISDWLTDLRVNNDLDPSGIAYNTE